MVTESELQAIMPGLPASKRAAMLPFLQAAMSEFDIGAPARQAAFLAQLAHESGELKFTEELWGPTPAQVRCEPPGTLATKLGNTEPGDGRCFKGRGPIQITGRANYRRFGDLLAVDLVSEPPRAAVPDLAFRIAGETRQAKTKTGNGKGQTGKRNVEATIAEPQGRARTGTLIRFARTFRRIAIDPCETLSRGGRPRCSPDRDRAFTRR